MFGKRFTVPAYPLYLIAFSGALPLFFGLYSTINLIYQVQTARLNPLQLVLVGTALEGTIFLFQIPTGVVADVYSRRLSLVIGTFLIGAGVLLEGAIPRFATIALGQALWGIGYTFSSGAEEAWIAGEVGEDRIGPVFLRGAQVAQVSGALGVLGGVALGSVRLNLPILVGGALIVALAAVLAVVTPESGFHRAPREERGSWRALGATLAQGVLLVRARPILLTILAVGLFWGMSSEGFDRLATDHFLKSYRFPAIGHLSYVVWFGLMSVVALPLSLGATELIRRRVDTRDVAGVARALLLINALLIGGIVVFSLAGAFPLAAAAYLLVGVMRQAGAPLSTAWLAQHTDPAVRATVVSLSGQVDALGQIAGGPVIGVIGLLISVRAALLAAAAALTPALPIFARTMRRDVVVTATLDEAAARVASEPVLNAEGE